MTTAYPPSPSPDANADDALPAVSQAGPPADVRPRSKKLGLGLLLGGGLATFLLMSQNAHVKHGPLWGLITVLTATSGVLELCGLLRALPGDAPLLPRLLSALPDEPAAMAPRVTLPIALGLLGLGLFLGPAALPIVLVLALLVLLVSGLRRPALFVFASASLLLLPMLGSFGLWDPWETHYGEVAREILARDDWITLWWAQDELFRSKPILIFWIEALTWGALGVPFAADANPAHPEWPIRLPHYALTVSALMACYFAVARNFGRRAAVCASLVLATTPYFFLLAHQAITDMPFVATMTFALAMFMIAAEAGDECSAKPYRVGSLSFSTQSLALGAIVAVALPQALYLLSRNITFVVRQGLFAIQRDSFMFGSAGNSNIPGNPAIRMRAPYLQELWYQPFAQGLLWLVGLAAIVYMLRKEQKTRALAMLGFYLACSLSWMAKGIPGFALPGLVVGLYLLATQRWELLLSGKLRVGLGILIIAVTGLPWYVAMYGRLGPFFTDRLLIHDHINRLAQGVHGDTGSIQYFLWQLGYGAFPWIGLAPVAFISFRFLFSDSDAQNEQKRRSALLLALWAGAAFALFNAMITKFHHYIFPAVPPLALLIGLFLDRALGDAETPRKERTAIALTFTATLALVLAVGGLYGDVRGVVPADVASADRARWIAENTWQAWQVVLALTCAGLGLYYAYATLFGSKAEGVKQVERNAPLSIAFLGSAAVVAFAGRDLAWALTERPLGHERLIQLFIYSYGRAFPDYLDYRPILSGFAITAFAMLVLASAARLRKLAVYGLLSVTFLFSAWALNVYLIDLSPHWSQRELVKRYYEERGGKEEPLIAWQMNWKGENLYTGNRVHVFTQIDNKKVTKWMEQNPGRRAYFVLEHSRMASFKRLMGKRSIEELTNLRDNNKFILVRTQI